MEPINGLIAAPFTPMTETGEINTEPVRRYAEHLIREKVSGAFVCGTTGEGISMTTTERKAVLEEWIGCSEGKLKIIAHAGGNCLPQSAELAAHAEKCGAYAVASFAPSFFRPGSPAELVDFLAPVAAAASRTPFYYYHIPSLTGVSLPVADLIAEAEKKIPNFAGVKYTHSDLYDMQRCMAYGNGKYEILHGYDEVLLAGLCLGIKSAIGSTYNYMPGIYLKIWEAFNSGNFEQARKYQQISVKIVRILIKYGGGVRAGKTIMEFIGIDCGPCRLPIRKFSPDEKQAFRKELDLAGFFRLSAPEL